MTDYGTETGDRSCEWREAQAAAKNLNAHKRPIPPVQAPGMAGARVAANISAIQQIERELETAVGEKALRLSVKLHQLRRSA